MRNLCDQRNEWRRSEIYVTSKTSEHNLPEILAYVWLRVTHPNKRKNFWEIMFARFAGAINCTSSSLISLVKLDLASLRNQKENCQLNPAYPDWRKTYCSCWRIVTMADSASIGGGGGGRGRASFRFFYPKNQRKSVNHLIVIIRSPPSRLKNVQHLAPLIDHLFPPNYFFFKNSFMKNKTVWFCPS